MHKSFKNIQIVLLLFSGACQNVGLLPQITSSGESVSSVVPTVQESATPDLSAASSAATISAIDSLTPSITNVIASPSPGVTVLPSETAIPLVDPDTVIPEGEIQIYIPGELSRVRSPIKFVANLQPSPNNTVLIELIGEDGRTLTRKIISAFPPGRMKRTNALTEIAFEIEGVAEAARLVVTVKDEYNRIRAIASVNLVLLSTGITQTNPYIDRFENIVIQHPSANVMILGPALIVTGIARTQSDKLLIVELIDREGTIIAFGLATVVTQAGEEYGFFAAELEYEVEEPTWVLIVVRESGDRISGLVHLSSIEMVISP